MTDDEVVGRGASRGASRVVLLAGQGVATNIVYNRLARYFEDVVVVQEGPLERWSLARRRAKKLGWPTVLGQVAFVSTVVPWLEWRARRRVGELMATFCLDPTPVPNVRRVGTVNDPLTSELLRELRPSAVVVQGTRIISRSTLESIECPVLNLHAGVTPTYRGVHGGYWALAAGRPDLVGTTVHLVDAGIDTGPVVAQATFSPAEADSIATYPYLHLASGLPLLVEAVQSVLRGDELPSGANSSSTLGSGGSPLRSHPTIWGYLWLRARRGVR